MRQHGRVVPDRLADLLRPWLGGGPAYAALAAGVRGLVLDGRLAVGARVPSERDLAAALGLSRTTVTAGYDALRDEGFLRSDRGAGSRIALPGGSARPDAEPGEAPDVLDLTVAALPAPGLFVDAVQHAALAVRPFLAGHGLHPLGLPVLREGIARHLSGRGLPTTPDQVLVTAGALHAWELLLRALTRPGQRVLVEQPTYPAVLDAVAAASLRPQALPVGAGGWEPVAPDRAVLAHVTPDGQNPTGLLAGDPERRTLLRRLRGTVVVADETFADLVLDGPAPLPLASHDASVVTVGSMSKAFWAGLRIGWVRCEPDLVARLAHARGGSDLASPVLEQLVAARLLESAQDVLPERRALLRASRNGLIDALRRELPDWRCPVPAAGMVLWVELPGRSSTRLAAHALDLGVRLTPGPRFTIDGTADRFLRLPFTVPPGQVDRLMAVLREADARTAAGLLPVRRPSRWTA